MYDEPTPVEFIKLLENLGRNTEIWEQIEKASDACLVQKWVEFENIALDGDEKLWPKYVFVPSEVIDCALKRMREGSQAITEQLESALCAGGAAWRLTKGTYRFEPELEWELDGKKDLSESVSVLYKLPAQCVVISVHGILPTFVYLDYDIKARQTLLRQIALSMGGAFHFKLPLVVEGKSADDATIAEVFLQPGISPQQKKVFKALLPHVVHLCKLDLDHSARQAEPKSYIVSRDLAIVS